ncbi:GNAT family N-acetyltransferase [Chthonobacter rhizosphaerae]|uniref:GNAT family N-acetyltransferase n=1 Tax=Chthonobacter rhizosphaerae TaxID=2735553 RepID=UPI0015EEC5E0|nr:N-acetyltransferase [Chthonobacter rhizosphaerae]
MITYLDEAPQDVGAREALLDRAFGPARFLKSSERIRAGRLPAEGLALVAKDGDRLVGTVRLWPVAAGHTGRHGLLLGPLAVSADQQGAGVGGALMRLALARAKALGHGAVLLVGDEPYYRRFGFSSERTGGLAMPGPYERHRFLALELTPGALLGAEGVLRPTGALAPAALKALAA